jgi:hypothetical protein
MRRKNRFTRSWVNRHCANVPPPARTQLRFFVREPHHFTVMRQGRDSVRPYLNRGIDRLLVPAQDIFSMTNGLPCKCRSANCRENSSLAMTISK